MVLTSMDYRGMRIMLSLRKLIGCMFDCSSFSSCSVPDHYEFGSSVVVPLKAGETVHWKCSRL